jgi:hypothetical protein
MDTMGYLTAIMNAVAYWMTLCPAESRTYAIAKWGIKSHATVKVKTAMEIVIGISAPPSRTRFRKPRLLMPEPKHPLPELIESLTRAREAALKLQDDGNWMKALALITSFTDALEIHNELHQILNKTCERIEIQNHARRGGRF